MKMHGETIKILISAVCWGCKNWGSKLEATAILVNLKVIQITNCGPHSKSQNNNKMHLKQCASVGDKSTWFSLKSVAWLGEYGLTL